ncbi:MAG TPA: Rid family hydrolase [Candidatus Sulfopaludibacter sp.]|nr:Rid family hydrolase [Candidatus Sulfopaludibacter sp.]
MAAAAIVAIHAGFAQSVAPQKQHVTYFPNRSPLAPYGSAVLVGDPLYVAGVFGLDPKTAAPPEKIEDEAKNVLDAYKIIPGRAGFGMHDLVDVQAYCTDLSYGDKFDAVYRTDF